MKSIGASVGLFGFFLASLAGADAGVPPDAGPEKCASSDDCAPPTPYCHPTRSVCVQCTSNVNCFGLALVCNTDKGVCATCSTNADCFGQAPYCSSSLNACVECLTDANCGKQGIKCKDGLCGSCGDGICSANEAAGIFGICKDCLQGCPKTSLGSKTGDPVSTGNVAISATPLMTACGPGFGGSEASFGWTAPSTGSFLISAGGLGYVAVIADDCAGSPYMCWTDQAYVSLNKGQKVAILLTRIDAMAGPYTLSIQDLATSCNPNFCPAGPTGPGCCLNGDAGACGYLGPSGCLPPGITPIDPTDVKNCLSTASVRMEPLCMEGPYCRCNNCPVPYQTCNNIDGCRQILSCMHRYGCANVDCYKPDRCQPTIDAYGGIGSVAFNYASQVVSCDYSSGCNECAGTVPPVGDASVGTAGFTGVSGTTSGTGARPTGIAGRPQGAGGRTGGGNEPDAGVTAKAPAGTSGGCDCGVARSGSSPAALSLLAGLLGLATARRRRRA